MIERILKFPKSNLPKGFAAFDIETSGLVRDRDPIFIIGFFVAGENEDTFYQFAITSEQEKEEKIMLEKCIPLLKNTLITYNGDQFDIPYMKARFKKFNLTFPEVESYDIYVRLRNKQKLFDFENLKLKTIEKHAGIEREDELNGKQVAEAFRQTSTDISLLEKVLLHNQEDVLNTACIYDYYLTLSATYSVPFEYYDEHHLAIVEKYYRKKEFGYIELSTVKPASVPLKMSHRFGEIEWFEQKMLLRFHCDEVQVNIPSSWKESENLDDSMDDIVKVDVTITEPYHEDVSPYLARQPILVLADLKNWYGENLVKVVNDFLKNLFL